MAFSWCVGGAGNVQNGRERADVLVQVKDFLWACAL